ncbi:Lysine--tRNA ligase, partial [Bienertia sinuspersici]
QYYMNNRIDPQKAAGINPLPNFEALMTIAEYTDKYGELNNGEYLEDVPVSLTGKITNKRPSSSKLVFYDLHDNGAKVQVVADARKSELEKSEFTKFHSSMTLNNIIGVTGFPGKTKRGVLSIFSKSFVVLSPHELGVDYLAKSVTDSLNVQEATKPEFEPSSLCRLSSFRVVVVGDIHEDWKLEDDSKALHFLKPDLVPFTGDFGNENVELVKGIAELNFPKGAILGNHDSWSTSKFSNKVKDGVQAQLECLGEAHVGYGHLDFPSLKLSVVGGRPFSCGGDNLFRKKLIKARYGVRNMEESAEQIYKAALQTPNDNFIILLSHNGPRGLGSGSDDICGVDWGSESGDLGDPDLAQAILQLRETTNYSIPLVVFGHMHKELGDGVSRKMIAMDDNNTMYLNAAIVPRVKPSSGGSVRVFTVVEFSDGKITKVAETWVSVNDDKASLEEEHFLFSSN